MQVRRVLALGLLMLLAVGCSAAEQAEPPQPVSTAPDTTAGTAGSVRGAAIPQATVEGPITGGRYDLPFNPMPEGLATQFGYVEEEYFIAGDARAYEAVGTWETDGRWDVREDTTAPYVTRIVVRRPSDPGAFDGTAIVEWHNVSSGLDSNPDFALAHEEALAHGSAWIGVSAQRVGVEGGGPFFTFADRDELPLKVWDPERYADLSHPGDDYSFDIFSQAAQALLRPEGVDPMGGLKVDRLIAIGESQSAVRLVTYVNAVHPSADLFDGFLLHSRFGSGAVLNDGVDARRTPYAWVRTDLGDPVFQVVSETDLFGLSFADARQPDTDRIRTWEVAGTAHLDEAGMAFALASTRRWEPTAELDVSGLCGFAVNDGPMGPVLRRALADLRAWVIEGVEPAHADQLETADGAIVRDDLGIAIGGVRTPAVDAPLRVLSGEGSTEAGYLCSLFGSTEPLAPATITEMYPSQEAYVEAVTVAAEAATDGGYLLSADADRLIEDARREPFPPS